MDGCLGLRMEYLPLGDALQLYEHSLRKAVIDGGMVERTLRPLHPGDVRLFMEMLGNVEKRVLGREEPCYRGLFERILGCKE